MQRKKRLYSHFFATVLNEKCMCGGWDGVHGGGNAFLRILQ